VEPHRSGNAYRVFVAGYSQTPLLRKLGLRPEHRQRLLRPARGLPEALRDGSPGPFDFGLAFCTWRRQLVPDLAQLGAQFEPAGLLWIAWPKKAARVPTDLDGNVVRQLGLAAGLVDVKVCAIDDRWSALKFVVRKDERPGWTSQRKARMASFLIAEGVG
jgi:hypothetical protein